MEATELAKEILIALIPQSPVYKNYGPDDKQEPAKVAAESYKIILKGIAEAIDEANKRS